MKPWCKKNQKEENIGLTRLRDGRYVRIHCKDFQGEGAWGEVISPERALDEIEASGNTSLLGRKKYAELKALSHKKFIKDYVEALIKRVMLYYK